jgi:thymidylate synthase
MTYETTSQAYLAALSGLLASPDYLVGPRGQPCREWLDAALTVERPASGPIVTESEGRNAKMANYLAAETELYLSGELRASVWAERASRFWTKLADGRGLIHSNYGWLALYNRSTRDGLTQWEWAKQSLRSDPDSRQAFVRFSLPEHQYVGNKDQVCTMHMIFHLRGGGLRGTVVMRSCDVVKGLAYDMPWFVLLLEKMAGELGVPVGTYTHFCHSLHLYERDVETAREMLGRTT